MNPTTEIFVDGLYDIAHQNSDLAPYHDRARHFARCALALMDSSEGAAFKQNNITSKDYRRIRYWLKVIAANGITGSDRATAAQYIIDVYIQGESIYTTSSLVVSMPKD